MSLTLTQQEYDAVNLAWKHLGRAMARGDGSVRVYEARNFLWLLLDDANTGRIKITGPAAPEEDREHTVEVPARDRQRLASWLERPNGALTIGRVTFEAVENGGVLVRTQPFRVAREAAR
jgi:hypothetical protein